MRPYAFRLVGDQFYFRDRFLRATNSPNSALECATFISLTMYYHKMGSEKSQLFMGSQSTNVPVYSIASYPMWSICEWSYPPPPNTPMFIVHVVRHWYNVTSMVLMHTIHTACDNVGGALGLPYQKILM